MAVLKANTMIKVINNTIGSLSFRGIDDKKYLFTKPNSYKLIPYSVIEGIYNDSENLISQGYILFDTKNVYEELGVPKEVYEKLYSMEQIKELLDNTDSDELTEELNEVSNVIKENVAIVAKDKKLDSKKKIKAIKEATGFDVEEQE